MNPLMLPRWLWLMWLRRSAIEIENALEPERIQFQQKLASLGMALKRAHDCRIRTFAEFSAEVTARDAGELSVFEWKGYDTQGSRIGFKNTLSKNVVVLTRDMAVITVNLIHNMCARYLQQVAWRNR